MTSVILNGKLINQDQAHISIADRGFRFGDGLFDTIAVTQGVPYGFAFHMDRMKRGLEALHISLDISSFADTVRTLLLANKISKAVLRIQVTRGIGSKGYLPDPNDPQAGACYVMETLPYPSTPTKPITLWHSSYCKPSPKSLPVQFKLTQGVNSILARIEAEQQHCFDALLCNTHKKVCEASSGNIFWAKNGVLYTPPLDCGALEGSMRHHVMRLCHIPVKQDRITIEALAGANAVLMTNAIHGILPVSDLKPQSFSWDSQEFADAINQHIKNDIATYIQDHQKDWC